MTSYFMNRIQKLLLCEYTSLDDVILVESPFAEVNRNGFGIRQVQIGLTSSNLIIATDTLPVPNWNELTVPSYYLIDPDIETLELVSVIPLKAIAMRAYSRGRRHILKIVYCTQREFYFEFGGHMFRDLYYNLWTDFIYTLRMANKPEYIEYLSYSNTTLTKTFNSILSTSSIRNSQLQCPNQPEVVQNCSTTIEHTNTSKKSKFFPRILKEFLVEYKLKSPSNSTGNSKNTLSKDQNLSMDINIALKQLNCLDVISGDEKCRQYLMNTYPPNYGSG